MPKQSNSFRKYVPDGKIGPSFAYSPAYPCTSHPDDILAFENAEEFTKNLWLDVYCWAKYPRIRKVSELESVGIVGRGMRRGRSSFELEPEGLFRDVTIGRRKP